MHESQFEERFEPHETHDPFSQDNSEQHEAHDPFSQYNPEQHEEPIHDGQELHDWQVFEDVVDNGHLSEDVVDSSEEVVDLSEDVADHAFIILNWLVVL